MEERKIKKTGVWSWDLLVMMYQSKIVRLLTALAWLDWVLKIISDPVDYLRTYAVIDLLFFGFCFVLWLVLRDLYRHKKKQEEMWADGSDGNLTA